MNTITNENKLTDKLKAALLKFFKCQNPGTDKIQDRDKMTISEINKMLKFFDQMDYEQEFKPLPKSEPDQEKEAYNEAGKDAFYEWHKYRVFDHLRSKKIIPTNIQTHTIVTANGHVCIIRKPIGRVLGKVMSKVGAFNKDPDFYEAGSIIYRECMVYCEDPIGNNSDELFAVKMACIGATNIMEAQIKKN